MSNPKSPVPPELRELMETALDHVVELVEAGEFDDIESVEYHRPDSDAIIVVLPEGYTDEIHPVSA